MLGRPGLCVRELREVFVLCFRSRSYVRPYQERNSGESRERESLPTPTLQALGGPCDVLVRRLGGHWPRQLPLATGVRGSGAQSAHGQGPAGTAVQWDLGLRFKVSGSFLLICKGRHEPVKAPSHTLTTQTVLEKFKLHFGERLPPKSVLIVWYSVQIRAVLFPVRQKRWRVRCFW